MEDIRELCRVSRTQVTDLGTDASTILIGDRIMPLMSLRHIFGYCAVNDVFSRQDSSLIAVIECNERYLALAVDDIVGQVQVVLKPLSESFSGIEFVAGAAILGDGSVALILTPQALLDTFASAQSASAVSAAA
jgi:two-component system chemotaxis sensor kinase CheA